MNTGAVLRELVGPQRWVVLPHVRGVAVTFAADFRNLLASDFALESCLGTHGVIGAGRIAAMTTGAGDAFLRMNAGGETVGIDVKRGVQRGVAVDAGIGCLRLCESDQEKRGRQPHEERVR